MAIMRLELKNYNKRQGKSSVAAHARYLAGQSIAAHAQHNSRERAEEQPRHDLIEKGHAHMPIWAQGKEMTYWEEADKYSRANACLGKEVLITLPRELSHTENLALIHRFLTQLPNAPTTWTFHEPLGRDGQRQPHCHILVSPKRDDGQERTPQQYFAQRNHGGSETLSLWTRRAEVHQLRGQWHKTLTDTLREYGLTLQHPPDRMKELRLSWGEMLQLKRFMQAERPNVWGHESRIPIPTIQQWQTEGKISLRQATFLTQRGQRQREWEVSREQPKVWEATRQVERTSKWQPLERRRAVKTHETVRKKVQVLEARTQQSARLYRETLQPALHQEKAKFHREKELERVAQQRRARSRGKGRGLQTGGAGLQVDLGKALDAQQKRRTRAQEREYDGWER